MALIVSITGVGGSPTYSLKCNSCEHSISRFPTQSPLVASDVGERGMIFLLDLGMSVEQIVLAGVIDSDGSPSKANLETVCREWWVTTNTPGEVLTATDYPILEIDSTDGSYAVVLKAANFMREGGTEQYWRFSLTFLVIGQV
jgi:hypothetical protein